MPKRVEHDVDSRAFFRKGESFFFLTQYLGRQDMDVLGPSTFAFITCRAFAAEVYLKVLAQIETRRRPLKTHNLRHLFEDLSEDSRSRIRYEWTERCLPGVRGDGIDGGLPPFWKPPQNFDQALDQSALAFVDWRYFYRESEPLTFHMIGLPPIIRTMILEVQPSWRESVKMTAVDRKSNLAEEER